MASERDGPGHGRRGLHRQPPRRGPGAGGPARARLRALQRPRRRRAAPLPPRRDAERASRSSSATSATRTRCSDAARGVGRRLPPGRAHRHPLLLRAPPRDGGHQRDRHAQRALRGAGARGAAGRPHLDERGLRHRAHRPHRRGAPAAGPVALLGEQDRRGQAGRELPPRVRRCPWSRSARSTPTARASRRARSSPRSPSRRCGATSSASARSPRPATSTSSPTRWTASCARGARPGWRAA